MVITVTVLAPCRAWISPSGDPELQVIRADGTVKVIVLPEIPAKTLLFPTEVPRAEQTGREMLAMLVHC